MGSDWIMMDRWKDRQINRWIDWLDRQMARQTNKHTDKERENWRKNG